MNTYVALYKFVPQENEDLKWGKNIFEGKRRMKDLKSVVMYVKENNSVCAASKGLRAVILKCACVRGWLMQDCWALFWSFWLQHESAHLGWGLKIRVSNWSAGGADAAGPGTTPWEVWLGTSMVELLPGVFMKAEHQMHLASCGV